MTIFELLSDRTRWTQRFDARDVNGVPVPAESDAACWCIYGAVHKCYPDAEVEGVIQRLRNTALKLGLSNLLSKVNDQADADKAYQEIMLIVKETGA